MQKMKDSGWSFPTPLLLSSSLRWSLSMADFVSAEHPECCVVLVYAAEPLQQAQDVGRGLFKYCTKVCAPHSSKTPGLTWIY